MRKFIPGSLFIMMPAIILFIASCTAGSCFEETESYLKATFYVNATPAAPDSLTLYGLNNDSLIYYKTVNVQPALIPLNTSTESSSFIIQVNGISDTIVFQYTSYPHLISKECGYTYYHQLDTLPRFTKHFIKDIYTGNKTITNLNVENIRIFY